MLTIPRTTLAWIILKAREFDVKDADSYDGEADTDDPLAVLEDRPDDPTESEIGSWISDLTDTQRAELVALFWLGRDDEHASAFPQLVEEARGSLDKPTAPYLLGSPMLADGLEEGLTRLGYNVAELESEAI